jgi:hypothetical protein
VEFINSNENVETHVLVQLYQWQFDAARADEVLEAVSCLRNILFSIGDQSVHSSGLTAPCLMLLSAAMAHLLSPAAVALLQAAVATGVHIPPEALHTLHYQLSCLDEARLAHQVSEIAQALGVRVGVSQHTCSHATDPRGVGSASMNWADGDDVGASVVPVGRICKDVSMTTEACSCKVPVATGSLSLPGIDCCIQISGCNEMGVLNCMASKGGVLWLRLICAPAGLSYIQLVSFSSINPSNSSIANVLLQSARKVSS